ncbi:MAG: radical SAM protein [Candidatus Omnitrophota bacterium]
MRIALFSVNDVVYDYGLRALSAYLKRHGHDVDLVFLTCPENELSGRILLDALEVCRGADLIGVSVLTHSVGKGIVLTQFLRLMLPGVPIIWGGMHASSAPEECIVHADIVCLGEGENTLLEIVERYSQGSGIDGIPGTWRRAADGSIVKGEKRPLIQDLDSLPPQDYSLSSDYVDHEGRLAKLDDELLENRLLYYFFNNMGRVYVTMTSRGCPFNCTFCCNNVTRQLSTGGEKFVRKRSIPHIMNELRQIKQRFPFLQSILFEDDSFLFRSVKDICEFADSYGKDIGLPFGIEMHPNETSAEKLTALKAAGLTLIHTGIQSGDERVRREIYHRKTTDDAIIKCNKLLTGLSITHKYDIIVDMPFEGDAWASLRLLKRLRPKFSINLYSMRLYPGLELRSILHSRGHDAWIQRNDLAKSYLSLSSDDPYIIVLRMYEAFPPNIAYFLLVHYVFNTRFMIQLLKISQFRRATLRVMSLARRLIRKAR